ncbi:MAG: DUF1499 domain-containing protein [Desulfobulbaceae bacterium]|uniref:DUF1499 domain-containing protein n=1 Tax=Candidatus Desulfobia pelagia TaxID=2841692 RepID=A0A8J6NAK2_9BACT|nr:DUF1499 domain-containing protein [Candidatus Desulfobia pelagia]
MYACVSSESLNESWRVSPLAFAGSPSKAWKTLQKVLLGMDGKIESVDVPFLHVTFRSRLFGFVDDLTCRLDEGKKLIHIRSAARTGYWDFGVNRKRMEELQRQFSSSPFEE